MVPALVKVSSLFIVPALIMIPPELLVMVPPARLKMMPPDQFSMVAELVIVPWLSMEPWLLTVTAAGTVTCIPDGMITVLPELIVTGGLAPPHVAVSFQFPLCVAVN